MKQALSPGIMNYIYAKQGLNGTGDDFVTVENCREHTVGTWLLTPLPWLNERREEQHRILSLTTGLRHRFNTKYRFPEYLLWRMRHFVTDWTEIYLLFCCFKPTLIDPGPRWDAVFTPLVTEINASRRHCPVNLINRYVVSFIRTRGGCKVRAAIALRSRHRRTDFTKCVIYSYQA